MPGDNPYALSFPETSKDLFLRKVNKQKHVGKLFVPTSKTTNSLEDKVKSQSLRMMESLDKGYLMTTNKSPLGLSMKKQSPTNRTISPGRNTQLITAQGSKSQLSSRVGLGLDSLHMHSSAILEESDDVEIPIPDTPPHIREEDQNNRQAGIDTVHAFFKSQDRRAPERNPVVLDHHHQHDGLMKPSMKSVQINHEVSMMSDSLYASKEILPVVNDSGMSSIENN